MISNKLVVRKPSQKAKSEDLVVTDDASKPCVSVFKCLFKKMNHFGHQTIIKCVQKIIEISIFSKSGEEMVF